MAKPKIETVQPDEIPEVAAMMEAHANMKAFMEAHKTIFASFEPLVERYNAALENAEKAVRTKQVSCGPFDLYQINEKYNAQKLHEELGREDFLKVGGKVETTVSYLVDKATLEMSIAKGAVPPEVAEVIVKRAAVYHTPNKVVLP